METTKKKSKFMITSIGDQGRTIVGTFDGTLEEAHRRIEKETIESQKPHAMWQHLGDSHFTAETEWKEAPWPTVK